MAEISVFAISILGTESKISCRKEHPAFRLLILSKGVEFRGVNLCHYTAKAIVVTHNVNCLVNSLIGDRGVRQ